MDIYQKFEQINTIVFDVDGVFTNGKLLVTESGELLRSVSTRDGLAVKMAIDAGINIAIITGGNSQGIKKRFKGLGVEKVFLGIHDKLPFLKEYINSVGIEKSTLAYMGDDLPDVSPLIFSGLPACPSDAVQEVVSASEFISQYNGGEGCVRDLIEKIMRAKSLWPKF